jgi:outer membrane receptor protein involved in Fe transport
VSIRTRLALASALTPVLAASALIAPALVAPARADDLQTITVIATTPLPGIGIDRDKLAAPVQTATEEDFRRRQSLNLADLLNQSFGSVHVNEVQGNPFQPDVNFRGYTASPLLGTPQGLSVYMDGVRVNQPFGDVVSWDLIPKSAIRQITLVPGSNPLYGLNTLGGALSIQTRDGRSDPGGTLALQYGSNQRRQIEASAGGAGGPWDWFLTGTLFKDDGWRDASPSTVRQLFGAVGWQGDDTRLKLTASHADNKLTGNGLQDQQFLARDWSSVYTRPDVTRDRASTATLQATQEVGDRLELSGNAYFRNIRTATFNGDLNDDSLDQSVYQPGAAERAALAAAGYTGVPAAGASAANTPFPFWRCIGNALLLDEPAEKCNGVLNSTGSIQQNYGTTVQATLLDDLAGLGNRLTVGGAYDESRIRFSQDSQLGYLNPDRSITPVPAYGDGVNGGDVDGEPYDTRVRLHGRTRTVSLFATDTLTLAQGLDLTLSGRWNRTAVRNRDQLTASGPQSLSGSHHFSRFNPAAGLTWAPLTWLTAYAGYNEGNRTPTAVELGCANPDQPCKLPNAMAGDPPLKQVVTRTWEGGLRGSFLDNWRWSTGLFRAVSRDDIMFVADDASGFGYFKNFGKTRRQGVEASLDGVLGPVTLGADYTFMDATYRSPEVVNGAGNSTNDAGPGLDGTIQVSRGDRIPLIPRHTLKAHADWQIVKALSLGVETITVSGSYARGNENNAHQPDGVYYLGEGRTGGYTVVNLRGRYEVLPGLEVTLRIDNLFDKRYATAAQIAATGFTGDGSFVARPFPAVNGQFPLRGSTFYAPGAPRLFWAGVSYSF